MATSNQSSVPPIDPGGCKCKFPDEKKGHSRNLVVCIDGTSNQYGKKNTNVIELYSQLVKNESQLTYYNSGIGTYAKPSWRSPSYWKQVLNNKVDLAIAWNFEKIVMSAYRWLADNYVDGDRIFLFGFSRGAYQVRTLAGMIHKVGLICRGNEDQIPFAYELYADLTSDNQDKSTSLFSRMPWSFLSKQKAEVETQKVDQKTEHPKVRSPTSSEHFKNTFSRKDARVHFLGVWDTVSSIGVVRGKTLPGTDSPDHTCVFRHALALDERRVKFLPEYARGGVMLDKAEQAMKSALGERNRSPHVKEVWFPGTHSDIGGGNVDNDRLDRRHPAFLWMTYEAISSKLLLNPSKVGWKWEELGDVHESLTGVWKSFEYLPFKRLTYSDTGKPHTWRWHRGRGRKINPGQKVHASVAFCKGTYCPKASLCTLQREQHWTKLVGKGQNYDSGWEGLLEMDTFDPGVAETIFKEIQDSENPAVWVHYLTAMTWSREGRLTLRGVENAAGRLVSMTQKLTDPGVHVALANAIMEFASDDPKLSSYMCSLRERLDSEGRDQFLQKTICNARPSYEKLKSIKTLVKDGRFNPGVEGGIDETDESRDNKLDSEIVQTLLGSLKSEENDLRRQSLNAIVGLAKLDGLRCMMLDFNIVDSLRILLEGRGQRTYKAITAFVKFISERHEDDEAAHRANLVLDAITELAEYDDLRCKMLDSDIVGALLRILRDKHWKNCRPAINAVTELAKYDDSRRKMLDSDICGPLLNKLGGSNVDLYVAILHTITQLAKGDISHKILDPGIVVTLFKRHRHRDSNVRRSTFNAITQLASHDDSRNKILNANFIVALLNGSQDSKGDVCEAALAVITELAKHAGSRNKIMSHSQIIAAPLKKLEDTHEGVRQAALNALTELAKHDDSRGMISNSHITRDLLKHLGDSSEGVRQAIINAITELAKYDDSRCTILDADIVGALLKSFRDSNDDVRHAAINSITELEKHDGSRRMILDSDLTGALLSLRDNDENDPHTIVNTVGELAKYDESRHTILVPNIVEALMKSLRNTNEDLRQEFIKTIKELAKHDDSFHVILDSDIFGTLLKSLEDADEDIRQEIINTITELVNHGDSRHKMMNSKYPQVQLMNLGDESWVVRRSALRVLVELAKYDDSRSSMLDSGIVAAVVKSLEDAVGVVRQVTLNAIAELAKHDNSRSSMLNSDSDIVGKISKMLQDGNREDRQAALSVITELEKHENSRHKLLDSDYVAIQLTKLGDDSDFVRWTTLGLIAELIKYDVFRHQMLNSGIIAALLNNLGHRDKGIFKAAFNAIAELAKYDDSRNNILDTDAVVTLLETLKDDDSDVLEAALEVIAELAKYETSRIIILNAKIVATILPLLEHLNPDVRQSAVNVTTGLAEHDNSRRELLIFDIVGAVLMNLGNLRYEYGKARQAAFNATKELAKHDDSLHKILDPENVSKIFTLLQDADDEGNDDTRHLILDVLSELATHDDLCRQRLDSYSGKQV